MAESVRNVRRQAGSEQTSRLSPGGSVANSGRTTMRATEHTALIPVFIFAGSAAAMVLSQALTRLLPAKYFYDAAKIRALVVTGDTVNDRAFDSVASVLRLTSLSEGTLSLVVLTIFSFCVWRVLRLVPADVMPGRIVGGVAMSYLLCSVYLMRYSKEFVILAIVYLVLTAAESMRGDLLIVASIVSYSIYFRPYWILVAVGFIGLRFVGKRWSSTRLVLTVAVVICVSVAVALRVRYGEADIFRETVNAVRSRSPDARTSLGRVSPSAGIAGDALNSVATMVLLVFPVPILLRSGLVFAAIGLGLAGIWIEFFSGLNTFTWVGSGQREVARARAACLVLALLAVQAQFEPDLGSALRHVSPLLPLILLVSCGADGQRAKTLTLASRTGHARSKREHRGGLEKHSRAFKWMMPVPRTDLARQNSSR